MIFFKYLMSGLLLVWTTSTLLGQEQRIPENYQLVYEQDFSTPQAINDFSMTDTAAWHIHPTEGNPALELFGKSNYEARVRAPFNIALLKNFQVGSFILEVRLAQTGKEYNHRDLCLFFNVQDPTNFYYVHLASVADDHANNIFLVNDEPRTKIATKTTSGTNWGPTNSWHTVRIVRDVSTGSIKIYFDNLAAPVMEANDAHFLKGHIGFGSFDDTGRFDNIKIWSPTPLTADESFFEAANRKH